MINNKKGATLVELIAAIAIIAMVITAAVTGIVFSQQSVLQDTQREDASMQAQKISDELLAEMSGKSFLENKNNAQLPLNTVAGATYQGIAIASTFPNSRASGDKQYTVIEYNRVNLNGVNIRGTQILVAVYYGDGEFVIIESFAPAIKSGT